MSAIIECVSLSGQTLYATVHNSAGQVWNTSGVAFENFNSAHWSNYVTSLTEQTATGYYTAAFPSSIPAGKYTEVYYQGSGTVGDTVIGSSQIYWNGTIEEQGIAQVLSNAAMTELTGIPVETPTVFQALMLLFMSLRNQHTATGVQESIYNNAGSPITTATLSDNGTQYTKSKFS